MGEVGLSDGDVVVLEGIEKEEEELKKERNVVTWESLVPRMFLRVLLVEGDDSTRQIITALLQKCNYKVSAVSDGSKAWEMLKDKPHNIDLILTEVQLPSISGLCLLTLIMGHEVCKNIPVIMMSSHDSIGIVFKCMMRGAADFLVKPIRRNEVTNYHVIAKLATDTTGSQRCKVFLMDTDGNRFSEEGILIGFDPAYDLAVLKVNVNGNKLKPALIGTSHDLRVGQCCFAIGNPYGYEHRLTTGVVSGLGREIPSPNGRPIRGAIQTDASINAGNQRSINALIRTLWRRS